MVATAVVLMLGASGCAQRSGPYSWGDRTYSSYDECMAAKRAHQRRMTVAGAAGGAVTGALLGGNFGETALAAGVGAAGGALIAGSRRC